MVTIICSQTKGDVYSRGIWKQSSVAKPRAVFTVRYMATNICSQYKGRLHCVVWQQSSVAKPRPVFTVRYMATNICSQYRGVFTVRHKQSSVAKPKNVFAVGHIITAQVYVTIPRNIFTVGRMVTNHFSQTKRLPYCVPYGNDHQYPY